MLVGHVTKDNPDRSRVTVTFAQWLDPDEIVASLSPVATVTVADGEVDSYPLTVSAPALSAGSTGALLMLDSGTPGLTYLVAFIAYGASSGREQTIEFTVAVVPATLRNVFTVPVVNVPLPDLSDAPVRATGGITPRTLASRAADEITPMDFGAIGDGNSHPASTRYATLAALVSVYPLATDLTQELDFLAWQAALAAGGLVTCNGHPHFVMCNAAVASMGPLIVVAGQSWVEGHGALLDFSAMRSQPNTQHFLPNYNFADSSGWENAPDYTPGFDISPFTFGGGQAYAPDIPSFARFGQQVTLAPGDYTIVVAFKVTLGASYALGNFNQPFGSVGFWEFGPGQGGNWTPPPLAFPDLSGVVTNGADGVTVTLRFNFNVATEWVTWPTFTGGGFANWSVTQFDIIPWVPSCAIWCTRDGSGEHYNIARPLRGLEILGADRANEGSPLGSTATTGVLFESLLIQDGNMTMLADCSVHGFGAGMWMQDGSYLNETRNTMIYECDIGLLFNGGYNAGENMRFYGGAIFNNLFGIMNPHPFGEISFYGTALDYCYGPISNNAGKIELHGVHVENNLTNIPLFHCTTGQIMMYGGLILGVAPHIAMSDVVPPIKLDTSNAIFTCFGTALWNLTSGTGEFLSGAGTFRTFGWINQGNAGLAQPGAAPVMDILGGAGPLEPVGNVPFVGTDPTGIALQGGLYSTNTGAVVTNRWTLDEFTVALSATHVHSGTLALACTKLIGAGANNQIVLLVPVTRGQDAQVSFWWLAPNQVYAPAAVASITVVGTLATVTTAVPHGMAINVPPAKDTVNVIIQGADQAAYNGQVWVTVTGASTFTYPVAAGTPTPATGTILWSVTGALYARAFWAQVIGTDAHGRPVFGPGNTFKGEVDIHMSLAGSANWNLSSFGSQYNPGTTDVTKGDTPGAPIWATHFAVLLDTVSLPLMTFYLDDVSAYVI